MYQYNFLLNLLVNSSPPHFSTTGGPNDINSIVNICCYVILYLHSSVNDFPNACFNISSNIECWSYRTIILSVWGS